MKKSYRAEPEPEADVPEPRSDAELDTGHPAWVRVVTLVVLAVFVLATIVAALV